MQVQVSELRSAANLLLDHLERTAGPMIDVEHDYYWFVEAADLYDPTRNPSELSMGQTSDDLTELRAIVSGARPPVNAGLVWLGGLLRVLGDTARG